MLDRHQNLEKRRGIPIKFIHNFDIGIFYASKLKLSDQISQSSYLFYFIYVLIIYILDIVKSVPALFNSFMYIFITNIVI